MGKMFHLITLSQHFGSTSIMNTYTVCMVLAMAVAITAEPPSFGGYGRGGGGGGGGGHSSGGDNWQHVQISHGGNEGQNVDHQLLEEVRKIVLEDEQQNSQSQPPRGLTSQYGPPPTQSRVVAVELGQIVQAIQKAQLRSESSQQVQTGYPAAQPSSMYGAPSSY